MARSLIQVSKEIDKTKERIEKFVERLKPLEDKLETLYEEEKEIRDRDFLNVCKEHNITLEELKEYIEMKNLKEKDDAEYQQEGF